MKTMHTRLLALLLALALAVSLTACGGAGNSASSGPDAPGSSGSSVPAAPPAAAIYPFINTLTEPAEVPLANRVELAGSIEEAVAQNKDVVGWISFPDTTINDPVVQSTNNSTYLHHTWLKEYAYFGAYWLDYESHAGARDALSRNTIIYGHNTSWTYENDPDDDQFSQLFKLLDKDFAKKHPYIYFSTTEEELVWEIFAGFYTSTSFNYINPNASAADFTNIINTAIAQSEFDYNVSVTSADKILTLSTCSWHRGAVTGYRFVVMAKLVPAAETLKAEAAIS